MNIVFPCIKCKNKESSVYSFSCEHHICYQCVNQDIFINHITEIGNKDSFTLECTCDKKGTLQVDHSQIFNIFMQKPFINEQRNIKEKCKIHKNFELNYYCEECGVNVCRLCTELKENEHNQHKLVMPEKIESKLKFRISQIALKHKTLEEFKKSFEAIGTDLYSTIESGFNMTLKDIDSYIDRIKEFRQEFINSYKKKLEEGICNFKLVKLFYLNFYHDMLNIDSNHDIKALDFLYNIKYELDNVKVDFNNSISRAITQLYSSLDQLEKSQNDILKFSFNYTKIPTNFRKVQQIPQAHKKLITSIVATNEDTIITGGKDSTIKSWEENNKHEFISTSSVSEFIGSISCLLLLKDKRLLSAASRENIIRVWEYKTKQDGASNFTIQQTISAHKGMVCALHQLEDGKVVSASLDRTLIIWEEKSGIFEYMQIMKTHSTEVYQFININKGRFAFASSEAGIVIFKQKKDLKFTKEQTLGEHKALTEHKQKVKSIAFLKDGRLVSAGDEPEILLWREGSKEFKVEFKLSGHTDLVNCLICLRDGRLASASKDKTIIIWNDDGQGKLTPGEILRGHISPIYTLIQLNDNRLCSSDADGNILLWLNKS